MISIKFKDLERSELAKDVIVERLSEAEKKFPQLLHHKLLITLSMENSPHHKGPDLFGVKLNISGPKFKSLVLEKKASSLYLAAALLQEALLELLNRSIDKPRIKARREERALRARSVSGMSSSQ